MNDRKNERSESRGMGVGYVSLIMLFAVICLTVIATLSYQAARANDKLNEKGVSFTDGYYAADSSAKLILSELDYAAYTAHQSGFFEDSFPEFCSEYENVTLKNTAEGYEVSFKENISERLLLSVKLVFFPTVSDGERYRIAEWKTVSADTDTDDGSLGVWDGENF